MRYQEAMPGRSMGMEARYATRKQQLRAECQVAPEIFDQVLPRLATFMAPFVETFCRQELDKHAHTSSCGLLADLARKNVASSAYRFGQDRLPRQRFLGWAPWEDAPLRQALRRQVAEPWGHADGVLVCDPSSFPKSGPESVGGARQWCGRLGKVHNCQGAVSGGYVPGQGHTRSCIRPCSPKEGPTHQPNRSTAAVP